MTRRDLLMLLTSAGAAPWLKAEQIAAGPVIVEFAGGERHSLVLNTTDSRVGPLAIRQVVEGSGNEVWQRSIEVLADRETAFNLELPYEFPEADSFYSWTKREDAPIRLAQDAAEPGAPPRPVQLFPFAGAVQAGKLVGVIGDCPGYWENRSQQVIDPVQRRIALRTGDNSARRVISGINGDSSGFYNGELDGWQHARPGELRRFNTWIFSATVGDLYGVQLAAHRALATAKGWNDSAVTAILRNIVYLLVRRNLLRPESRYILISGATYGWKQWVSDMAMEGLGLADPEILSEGVRGIFWGRCNYEDNAQWYLIISALVARTGFHVDRALCRRCLEFMRDCEKDGTYIPPAAPGSKEPLGWKTYMDLFYYVHGDAPVSNQGFHCGALVAARELGLPVTGAEILRASDAYAGMFNREQGYFPTSVMRPEVFGGDALYGEAVTFAAFGKKTLPDGLVLRHCRHALKIQSPYGIRVVSKANGDLLDADQYGPGNPHGLPPEKAGAYVQGGSWFFCDAGTWLAGLAHGLRPAVVDDLLIRRIKLELARVPTFSESINTRTGEPHGNFLYGSNALYLWMRTRIRERLGLTGPDPVDAAVDQHLARRG
jgi:hypothetical protein